MGGEPRCMLEQILHVNQESRSLLHAERRGQGLQIRLWRFTAGWGKPRG